jgi:hypothetical protein
MSSSYPGDYYKDPYTHYGYRRIPYECDTCRMTFHKQFEFENHRKSFCIKSIYNDRNYLDYITLREKIKEDHRKKDLPTIRQLMGFEKIEKESAYLDEMLSKGDRDLEKKKEYDNLEEIDRHIAKWKSQKSVLGIRSSDIEVRIEQLLALLDKERDRRDRYLEDMDMFRTKLEEVKVATTKDIVKKRALEDVVIKRDELFEKENELFSQCRILKTYYLKIKDQEFQGKSAPPEMYSVFQEVMTNCEYLDELVETKRNYIFNNFETASQDAFLKFFSENGKNLIYDVETLKNVIKRTAVNIDNLKGDLRDNPRQLISDSEILNTMKIDRSGRYYSLDDVVLKTAVRPENYQDQSTVLRNVRRNIQDYGLDLGLRNTNALLVPRVVVEQARNKY